MMEAMATMGMDESEQVIIPSTDVGVSWTVFNILLCNHLFCVLRLLMFCSVRPFLHVLVEKYLRQSGYPPYVVAPTTGTSDCLVIKSHLKFFNNLVLESGRFSSTNGNNNQNQKKVFHSITFNKVLL